MTMLIYHLHRQAISHESIRVCMCVCGGGGITVVLILRRKWNEEMVQTVAVDL